MADRIGVIDKGELMLVEEKAELMRKLGSKQLTLRLAEPLAAHAGRRSPATKLSLAADGGAIVYTYDAQGEQTGITDLLGELTAGRDPLHGPADQGELARGDLRQSGEGRTMNIEAVRAIYKFEMARTFRTPLQSDRRAGDFDVALFHRLRRRHRLAHHRDRRGELRRLHRAGADHADAPHPVRVQRLVRHLLPEVHRHDLRAALGAGVLARDRRSAMSGRRPPSR